MIYCNDDRQQIRIVVHNSANLQPTVVIKYNAEWVAANPQGIYTFCIVSTCCLCRIFMHVAFL